MQENFSPSVEQPALTTFTLFGFPEGSRYWAFRQMGVMPRYLKTVSGLKFWKLLGAGTGQGFSLAPDFGRYGFLAVWESKKVAEAFFKESEFIKKYKEKSYELWNSYLAPLSAHGSWSGCNPFADGLQTTGPVESPVAILTRASIRTAKLIRFWKHVPATSQAIADAPGLIASIGVGEWPLIRQATVSFWKDMNAATDFAYANKVHREVIKKTREEAWYKEELFARFNVMETYGHWHGKNPLQINRID